MASEARSEVVAVGLGAGGHARSVLDALLAAKTARVLGMLDADPARAGGELLGVPVLGGDALLPELCERGATHFFVGLGSVGDCANRRRLYELGRSAGLEPLRVLHPGATISAAAEIAPGAVVLASAVVGPGARVGANAIVNTAAVVEHDCQLGAHVHVAIRATLCGAVRVLDGAHVGAGAVVLQGLTVGSDALVAAGALVLAAVPNGSVVLGAPARAAEAAA